MVYESTTFYGVTVVTPKQNTKVNELKMKKLEHIVINNNNLQALTTKNIAFQRSCEKLQFLWTKGMNTPLSLPQERSKQATKNANLFLCETSFT